MKILSEIKSQQLAARKARKDRVAINLLTVLLSEVERIGRDKGRETTDEEAVLGVRRMLKSNAELMGILEAQERSKKNYEAWKEAQAEKKILKSFLPTQLDKEETAFAVAEAVVNVGATSPRDMGKIMKKLKDRHGTKIDMKLASGLVQKYTFIIEPH